MKLKDHSDAQLRKLLASVKEKVSIKEYYKKNKADLIKAMRAHPALSFDERSGSDSVKIMVKADVIGKTTPKKAKAVKKKAEGTTNITEKQLTEMIKKTKAKNTKNVTKAELTEMINKKKKDLKKTKAKN